MDPGGPPTLVDFQLPQGMTLNDLFNRVPVSITVSCAAGILLWDHFQLIPHEMKAYYSTEAPHWRPWDLSAFILMRYAGITSMIGFLLLHVLGRSNCEAIWILVQASYVTAIGASCFLLTLRVSSKLWYNDIAVTASLSLIAVMAIGSISAVASQGHVTEVPGIPMAYGSKCVLQPFVNWLAVEHASVLAFDVFCLVFALGKLPEQREKGGFGLLHYKECIPYYVVAAIGNAGLLAIQLLPSEYDIIKGAAAPYSVVITVATGSRVALNTRSLRECIHRRGDHSQTSMEQRPATIATFVMARSMYIPPAPPAASSSVSSSPTIVPRKMSDPFSESQPKSSLSSRSRTPSPLPLAHVGATFEPTIKEVDDEDTLPDTPVDGTPNSPDTSILSPATPMSFAPGSPASSRQGYLSTVPQTPMTGRSVGTPMSPIEFAPVVVPPSRSPMSHGGSLPGSAGLPTPGFGQRLVLDARAVQPYSILSSPLATPLSASSSGSPIAAPLPKDQYTTFPSPPSSTRSLTFTPPGSDQGSRTSPFGRFRPGMSKQHRSKETFQSGWTE